MNAKNILAYSAGIIDGEGCISIYKHKSNAPRGFVFTLTVRITHTNEWLIQ